MKKKRQLLLAIPLVIALATVTSPVYASTQKETIKQEQNLTKQWYVEKAQNVYKSQSPNSKVITKVKAKQTLQIVKAVGSWSYIKVNNKKGWIKTKEVKLLESGVTIKPETVKDEDKLSGDMLYDLDRGIPSLKYMKYLLDITKTKGETWTKQNIDTKQKYFSLLDEVYSKLPQKVTVYSTVTEDELEKWSTEYSIEKTPSKNSNMNLLANYSVKKIGGKVLTITDKTNSKYSAKTIETALNAFSLKFSESIKDKTDEEKVKLIYNYMYKQYSYNASGYSKMMVGNAPNMEMACNGFTRLFYALTSASGVETRMVRGDDHYWNQWKTPEGDWVTIDVTTDILLNTEHGATGLSREEHIKYVSNVGFYFARPIPQETNTPSGWSKEQKDKFLTMVVRP